MSQGYGLLSDKRDTKDLTRSLSFLRRVLRSPSRRRYFNQTSQYLEPCTLQFNTVIILKHKTVAAAVSVQYITTIIIITYDTFF